jgi:hypothetical protein
LSNHSFAPPDGGDSASLALIGSSMMMMSPPSPVAVPSTDEAMR